MTKIDPAYGEYESLKKSDAIILENDQKIPLFQSMQEKTSLFAPLSKEILIHIADQGYDLINLKS